LKSAWLQKIMMNAHEAVRPTGFVERTQTW
jgi:hypothetical protein